MLSKWVQSFRFLMLYVPLSMALLLLVWIGVDNIPFGTFGKASVGDAFARLGLIMLLSPVAVLIAGYITWALLNKFAAIRSIRGFAWRLPLFGFGCVLFGWISLQLVPLEMRTSLALNLFIAMPTAAFALGALIAAWRSFTTTQI